MDLGSKSSARSQNRAESQRGANDFFLLERVIILTCWCFESALEAHQADVEFHLFR
jgi:hypothetical protein